MHQSQRNVHSFRISTAKSTVLLQLVYTQYTHTHTPHLTPNTKHKNMYRSQGDHVQLIHDVLKAVSVKMWPHVMWHREYQNGAIHLPNYGVTSQMTHYLWVLRFSWWQHFRFWSSVMWCCITGWVDPASNMFLENTGCLGSSNSMAAHPRRMEFLRNIIFMYKLSAHYWCISTWIFTSYVPWHMINWPNISSTQWIHYLKILPSHIHVNTHTVLERGIIRFQGKSLLTWHPNLLV